MIEGETVTALIEVLEHLNHAAQFIRDVETCGQIPERRIWDCGNARQNVAHALALVESILNKGR